MKVLLCKNKDFLERHRQVVEMERIKEAVQRTRELLLMSAKWKAGSDGELEEGDELAGMTEAHEEEEDESQPWMIP